MNKTPHLLTICISTHEMGGKGADFLRFSLDRIVRQTFKDFDVIISDQSADSKIKDVCAEYVNKLDIAYLKEPTGVRGSSVNINNAIRHATGKLVKIIFLDDFLYHDGALREIVDNFDMAKDRWLITGCICTYDGLSFHRRFHPHYDDRTILKKNTISSPSVLTIRNDDPVLFDEKLIWYMDTDYYKRCYDRFGMPKILDTVNVVNREGPHQVSHTTATLKRREDEYRHMLDKYDMSWKPLRLLAYRLQVHGGRFRSYVKSIIRPRKTA